MLPKTIEEVEFTFTGKEYKWNNIDITTLTKKNLNALLSKAFNFYNYHKSNMVKRFVIEYLKTTNSKIDISQVQEDFIPKPLGWYSRMITCCGFKPTQEIIDYMNDTINSLSQKYTSETPKEVTQVSTSAQKDEIVSDINFILGKFDGELDKFIESNGTYKFNFKEFIAINEVKPRQVSRIKEYVEKMFLEVKSAFNGSDKELVEGYSNFSKPLKKKILSLLEDIMNTKSYEKKNTKSKRQERSNMIQKTTSIASDISDATAVWVLSQKYNCIIHYVPEQGKTISLQGKTLSNVDRSRSTCKKVSAKEIDKITRTIEMSHEKEMNGILEKFNGKLYPVATRFDAAKSDVYKLIRVV